MKKRDEVDEMLGREIFCWICLAAAIGVTVFNWVGYYIGG